MQITCANAVTFVIFRLIPLLLMYRWVLSQKGIIPYSIYLVSFLAGLTLIIIQFVLFYRLLVADFGLFGRRRHELSCRPACAPLHRSDKSDNGVVAAASSGACDADPDADSIGNEPSRELPFLDALSSASGPHVLDPLEPLFAENDPRAIDPTLDMSAMPLPLDVTY